MSVADQIKQDDLAHILRNMQARLTTLERKLLEVSPVGAIIDWPLSVRSPAWSHSRDDAVGTNWTRRYKFNEINQGKYWDDQGGLLVNRITVVPHATETQQGFPGLLTNEGSYSVNCRGNTPTAPFVNTGTRGWTAEAIFMPTTLPVNANVWSNGFFNGYGLKIENGSNAAGSGLYFRTFSGSVYSLGVTAVVGRIYDVVLVNRVADNTLYWSIGEFNPVTKAFTLYTGSVVTVAGTAPASLLLLFANFLGRVEEVTFYTGEIAQGGLKGMDDRARSIQPAAPTGWLACDGTAVARNQFPKLFREIGTSKGAGDGTTTFNLPTQAGSIIKF